MKNSFCIKAGLGTLWLSTYLTINYLNATKNKEAYLTNPIRYKSEREFLNDLDIEKRKIGLDGVNILWKDDSAIQGGHSRKFGKNTYLITFNPHHKTKQVLRHELYHIKKMSSYTLDDILNLVLLGEYEEWKARDYSMQ